MATRFTKTEKWKDDWFLSLNNDWRIIWQYINDHCLISGLWKKEFKALNYFCNTTIDEAQFCETFKGKFQPFNEYYFFFPTFLKEQYPNGLKVDSKKPMILSVIKEISLFNHSSIIKESLGNDFLIIQGKGKGKGNKKKVEGNKKTEVVIVLPFESETFKSKWEEWKSYKAKEHNFKYKAIESERAALSELANISLKNESTAIKIIDKSISKGWKGFFELKDENPNGKSSYQSSSKNRSSDEDYNGVTAAPDGAGTFTVK